MTTTATDLARADWLLAPGLAPNAADAVLAPLYAGAARGELVLPSCGACGLALELEQRACDRCDSADVVWAAVAPTGEVHSATTVHRRERGLVLATEPYPVVDVELASGHRLVMTTLAPRASAPAIGEAVRIGFRSVGGVAVPAAELAAAEIRPVHPSDTEVTP
ncbi:Zn-ribbon domain-containing OB-fold protein [uncultured Modestobacter sp.]|uniref:Zn-ribbon domain-containing OB-fold protein n=1 Tax=uncultured Modestobacter sp. TaxID=380048 RepID=UPI00262BAEB0|nr:OB-fold domain-containing protein [uncultured Modestobacter sp.]